MPTTPPPSAHRKLSHLALRRAVLVGVEATDSLLPLAFRTDPAGDEALVAHINGMREIRVCLDLLDGGGTTNNNVF